MQINSTGGLPGKTMKLKESEKLKELAAKAGMSVETLSDKIISEFEKRQILDCSPCYWGMPLSECYVRDVTISEVVSIIRSCGVKFSDSDTLDIILESKIIGEGDCPECGGEMEPTDGEYKVVGGDGYSTPYVHEAIWEELTCKHCGYRITN